MFSLDIRIHSEVGRVRKNNQDAAFASPNLLVVADGMGGAAAGDLASAALEDYLTRHPEMACRLSQGGAVSYRTTECPEKFEELASIFMGREVNAVRVKID